MNTNRIFKSLALGAVAVSLLASGCARVKVMKVSGPKADQIEGFRYYLPRPYLTVKKPFPVAGEEAFVWGTVKDDKVVELDAESLIPELRKLLPSSGKDKVLTVSQSQIRAAFNPVANAGLARNVQQSAGSGTSAATGNAMELTSHLTGTNTPSLLTSEDKKFTVSLKLAKSSPFTSVDVASIRVGLMPKASDGSVKTDGFVDLGKPASGGTEYKTGSADGAYSAEGIRSELKEGADFVQALKFEGRTNETQSLAVHLVYSTKTTLRVDGGKSPEPAKAKEGSKDEQAKKTEETDVTYSSAKVTTSGDPRTDPLSKVNDYFDVLLLPDFDEQYAIRVTAGLGLAKANIGLENGWMVEQASMEIDNRELGKFVYNNISKVIDMGLKLGEAYLSPATAAADALSGTNKLTQQSLQKNDRVLLRIRYAIEAQPGIYPILKPREPRPTQPGPEAYVFAPYPPYTVVAYNVRRYVVIEAVSTVRADGGSVGTGGGARSGEAVMSSEDVDQFIARIVALSGQMKLNSVQTTALKALKVDDFKPFNGVLTLQVKKTNEVFKQKTPIEKALNASLREAPLELSAGRISGVKVEETVE